MVVVWLLKTQFSWDNLSHYFMRRTHFQITTQDTRQLSKT